MRTTVIKLTFSIGVLGFIFLLLNASDQNKTVDSKIQVAAISALSKPIDSQVNRSDEKAGQVIQLIDPSPIRGRLQSLNKDQLEARKIEVEQMITQENFVEKLNRNLLNPGEILKFRKLALESSLITVRLMEMM